MLGKSLSAAPTTAMANGLRAEVPRASPRSFLRGGGMIQPPDIGSVSLETAQKKQDGNTAPGAEEVGGSDQQDQGGTAGLQAWTMISSTSISGFISGEGCEHHGCCSPEWDRKLVSRGSLGARSCSGAPT